MERSHGNPTAVVTGGTGALGVAVVRELLRRGWRVRVPWHTQEGADTLRAAVDTEGERLAMARADVTDPRSVEAFFAGIAEAGPVHGLCNLVGGFEAGPVATASPEAWMRMMDLNARSAFLCARSAIPLLRKARGGRIVSVASLPTLDRGAAGMAAYAASKAAVVSLTRSLAAELRADRITVNAVAPETLDTEANRTAMPEADPSTWLAPADVAKVVAFLLGDEAAVVTGSVLRLSTGTSVTGAEAS